MESLGEKRVRFQRPGETGVNGITIQVMGASKPLASVSCIFDRGYRVVRSRRAGGSYIENVATGDWLPPKEEKGKFVLRSTSCGSRGMMATAAREARE